jgi:hypothetical protein
MVVVSSSNTNITPFFQSCCYMLVVFHSLFSLFIILYVIVPIWAFTPDSAFGDMLQVLKMI